MASKYDRRNERAREQGWSGYGQQRKAKELGYRTPAEYAAALRDARKELRRVEPSPFVLARRLRGAVDVRTVGARRLIGGPWGSMERVGGEIARFADHRRATLFVDGRMWGKRGYTIGYLRELREELGSWKAVVEHIAATMVASASDGPGTDERSFVSVEIA